MPAAGLEPAMLPEVLIKSLPQYQNAVRNLPFLLQDIRHKQAQGFVPE